MHGAASRTRSPAIADALATDGLDGQRALAAAAIRIRRHDLAAWWRRDVAVADGPKTATSTGSRRRSGAGSADLDGVGVSLWDGGEETEDGDTQR